MSGREQPEERRRPRGRRREDPEPKRKRRKKVPKHVIVHVRIGLEDDVIRLTRADFDKLVYNWQLAGEDIVLRGMYNNIETQILLRGEASGRLGIRDSTEQDQIPLFNCHVVKEIRAQLLEQAGIS